MCCCVVVLLCCCGDVGCLCFVRLCVPFVVCVFAWVCAVVCLRVYMVLGCDAGALCCVAVVL